MPGQSVDLGGIAKGYAGDEAIKIYKKHGIKSAYVNLGGNVVTLGTKPDGTPWRIGIQNPRAQNGYYLGTVEVTDKAIVTSGDYERYFEADQIRYHHILDPQTGYPADSGLMSATVVTDVSVDADALSTAVFTLGLEKGMAMVKSLKGVEAILVTKDKEIYITEGIKSSFTFTDGSKEFKYVEKS
jgi:thiamine biosynthesis lipoprotein